METDWDPCHGPCVLSVCGKQAVHVVVSARQFPLRCAPHLVIVTALIY